MSILSRSANTSWNTYPRTLLYCYVYILALATSLLFPLKTHAQQNQYSLVGYWHNWNDAAAPYIPLPSINNEYNVIQVAFAIPQAGTDYHMTFVPDQVSPATFASQISTLQSQGKKVLLSVGGATAPISLDNAFEQNTFVTTMLDIVTTYGFDGIDIDLEGASVTVSGGTITSPTDAKIINLINAIKQIMAGYRASFGKKMWLTMAPETAFVQGGMAAYGSIWGAYLPVIHSLRDSLDILHVQLYNSGSMYGIDGNIYSQGTADFVVAMTEAVIQGFNTAGGFFKGLPAEKVAIGLPACPSAAGGGYITPAVAIASIQYLRGTGLKPGNYSLAQFGGYPTLRGMMTWSINWDAISTCAGTYEFANIYNQTFDDSTYYSMQFAGMASQSQPNIDRVNIPIDTPHKPVDTGLDFTLEWWIKATPGENAASACGPDQWGSGNVIIDRDVFGSGDHGDYGISICNRRITMGVQRGNLTHCGISGSTIVDDGVWHHIAITRQASSGVVNLYVDGNLDAAGQACASTGDVSYRDGRSTIYPNDPTLVLGAEKHDSPGAQHFHGLIDDVRISQGIRYSGNFTKPWRQSKSDSDTRGLYHFDEGQGITLHDISSAAGGPSDGSIQYGTGSAGPFWSVDTPFQPCLEVTNTLDSGPGSLRHTLANAPSGSIICFAPRIQNMTINVSSTLIVSQNVIIWDRNENPVQVTIAGNGPVMEIPAGKKVVCWNVHLTAGTGAVARALRNYGQLILRQADITDPLKGNGNSVLNLGTIIVQQNNSID